MKKHQNQAIFSSKKAIKSHQKHPKIAFIITNTMVLQRFLQIISACVIYI